MKAVLLIIIFFIAPAAGFAASTTVYPFEIEFFIPKDKISINAQLTLNCRYEKWVIGDTAEYVDNYVDYNLEVDIKEFSKDLNQVSVFSNEKKSLFINGAFKSNKECTSFISIEIKDQIYSIGWADRFSDPIRFELTSASYDYSENHYLKIQHIKDILDSKTIEFYYKPVPGFQVNVWLFGDGKEIYDLAPTSAAINPETNMPFKLIKN